MSDGITAGHESVERDEEKSLKYLAIARGFLLFKTQGKIPERIVEVLEGLNRYHTPLHERGNEMVYPELGYKSLEFIGNLINNDVESWASFLQEYPYHGEMWTNHLLFRALKDCSPFSQMKIFFVRRYTNGSVGVEMEPDEVSKIREVLKHSESGSYFVFKNKGGPFQFIETE